MRRKEIEITNKTAIEEIIRTAHVWRLALSDENQPYIIPVILDFLSKSSDKIYNRPEGQQ